MSDPVKCFAAQIMPKIDCPYCSGLSNEIASLRAERDALLYNAESQYCAGMSAGFELGRNDDRAELSRIITQRWKEIADAKAHAALAPSPAGREG